MPKWSVDNCKKALGKELYHTLRTDSKIAPKYMMFIAEYTINGFSGVDAYIKILAPKKSKNEKYRKQAAANASALLNKPIMKEALGIVVGFWLQEKKGILERKIIETLYSRAFYDPSLFIKIDGSPTFTDWKDIPEKWRVCVEGIETRSYGKDGDKQHTIIKLANRDIAMEKLSKYIILYKEPDANTTGISADTVERLAKVFRGQEVEKK